MNQLITTGRLYRKQFLLNERKTSGMIHYIQSVKSWIQQVPGFSNIRNQSLHRCSTCETSSASQFRGCNKTHGTQCSRFLCVRIFIGWRIKRQKVRAWCTKISKLDHRLKTKMDDMTAPSKWSQGLMIAPCWLAAVQVIHLTSSTSTNRTWTKQHGGEPSCRPSLFRVEDSHSSQPRMK